jgi:hypothetical protein
MERLMRRLPILLTGLTLLAGPAAAQTVLFDFNGAPFQAQLPLDLTAGSVTAHLSATGQGYSIQRADVLGFTPAGFAGYCLYPNSISAADLLVGFSQPLTDFSIMYAPQELGCDTSATMRVTGYTDGAFVATNTTTAPHPGTWPVGLLTLSAAQGFNSAVIHYEARPACQDFGTIFMADNMTVTLLDESLFVPIVLSSSGVAGSFYTTELTLTNRGASDVTLNFSYVSAFGGGGGAGTDIVGAGQQRVVPDAIAYLKSLGIQIPDSGNRGGTLRVLVSGAALGDIGLTARTTTAVANGRAGLAYSGMPPGARLLGPSYLSGLRQNGQDRSNVALQNAGNASAGDVTLRLTVYSGDPAAPSVTTLPDVTLSPGGWQQINAILASNGLSLANGYVRVERVSGTAPYAAYAVINDQANSDGSFVPAVPMDAAATQARLALPVLVETLAFSTELVATNWTASPKNLTLTYVADAIGTPDHTAAFTLALAPGEQKIVPDFVAFLRGRGTAGIGPAGPTFAGALFAVEAGGNLGGVVLGARVSTLGGGGRFGLFFTAQAVERQTASALWLFGLQQNAENRTNLALVNLGQPGDAPDVFDIELYDGVSGAKVSTLSAVGLGAQAWKQYGAILSTNAPGVTQGYAHVVRTSGTSPFFVYGAVNDGGAPGLRTGDGAFVWAVP